MAQLFRIILQCFILLQSWTYGDGISNTTGSPAAKSAAAVTPAAYSSPVFKVATSNQVVWKRQGVQNISINISSSSRSQYKSVIGWCTQLLESVNSDADVDCTSAPGRYDPAATDHRDDMGNITIPANVTAVPPILMRLNWSDIRPDSEYMVAARLVGLQNADVPPQPGFAMFIYGVASGSCPPGTVNRNQQTQPPLTFHEPNATLQDMYLEVCQAGSVCNGTPANVQRKFLHPTFSPVEHNYSALVPHSSSTATLVLRSIRHGDTVFFDASECDQLKNMNQTITQERQEVRYNITPQLGSVCNLTISVTRAREAADFNVTDDERTPNVSVAEVSAFAVKNATKKTGTKTKSYNFTVTIVQLLDPMDLQLTTIAITNSSHTLVLCGNYTPRVFQFPKEQIIRAEPFSPRCDEGTCFSVYADQVPKHWRIVPNPTEHLATYITAMPVAKPFAKGNASYEKLSITIKSEEQDIYNQISYRLLVIHNASDPDSNTEKLVCSTMTSTTSDVMPAVTTAADSNNGTSQDQTLLKKWIYATRNPSYPNHPAQDKSCLVCPSGTHSAKPDADACQYCPPGYYSNLSQWPAPLLSTCKPCKAGTFSSWGARACRRCWAGTYSSGNASTMCQLCPAGKSTKGDGALSCDINVTTPTNTDYDSFLLQFEVELMGTFNLDQLPVATGINSTGPAILSYLMRRDVAAWLNVSTEDVDTSLPVARARHLIKMDVSAKLEDESEAARSSKQLTSDEVVAGLSEGEAVKYTGASQVNVRILSKIEMHRKKRKQMQQLHAILWPVLLGSIALAGTTWWLCRRYLRRRNRKMPLQMQDTTGFLRWLNRDSVGHSSVSGGELATLDAELPDFAMNSSTSPTPGVQRHRKQFLTNYSSDDSP